MNADEPPPPMMVDGDVHPFAESEVRNLPTEIIYLIGSVGLVAATLVDTVAVAGRHLGFRFLGSIELIQVSVVLVAAASMIIATIVGSHAAVHILTERLSARARNRLARISALLSALLFLGIAFGSAWVAADLLGGFEQTELLAIPLGWFRALWIVSALLIAILFLASLLRRSK